MNKVTLNGKPPTERMNLVKKQVDIIERNVLPFKFDSNSKIHKVKIENDYYIFVVYKYRFKFYKMNIEKEFTEITLPTFKLSESNQPNCFLIEDNKEIILVVGGESPAQYEFFKYDIVKNEWSLIADVSNLRLSSVYKKNEEYLLNASINSNSSIYITKDFKNFTDLRNKVTDLGSIMSRMDKAFFADGELYLIGLPTTYNNDSFIFNFENKIFRKGYKLPTPEKSGNYLFLYLNINNAKEEVYVMGIGEKAIGTDNMSPRESEQPIVKFDKNGYTEVKKIATAYNLRNGMLDFNADGDIEYLLPEKGHILTITDAYIKEW